MRELRQQACLADAGPAFDEYELRLTVLRERVPLGQGRQRVAAPAEGAGAGVNGGRRPKWPRSGPSPRGRPPASRISRRAYSAREFAGRAVAGVPVLRHRTLD